MTAKPLKSETTNGLQQDVDAFLRDRKAQGFTKGTQEFYRKKLAKFIAHAGAEGVREVETITPDLVRGFILALEEQGHNPGGIHAYYRALKAFLRWWESENEPKDYKNPIAKVKAPRLPDEPLEGAAREDIDKLVETCEGDFYGSRDKAIIRVLLDTGVRAEELTGFTLADLDLGASTLLVRKGKGRKPRTVYIGKSTRRTLRAWLRERGSDSGALFTTSDGERLTYWGLREIIRRRAKDAGIPAPGLHDFRRAFTLAQLRAGVDVLSISRMLGHATILLVARYARQNSQDLHEKYKSPVDGAE